MKNLNWLWTVVLGGAVVGLACADETAPAPAPTAVEAAAAAPSSPAAAAAPTRALSPNTRFALRLPDTDAVNQIASEVKAHDLTDALRLTIMAATPQANWFTSGTPAQVKDSVKKVMAEAALTKTVPVLVSYNIPFRDCAQYSAGGAVDTAAYEAWIDGFAAGIGKGQAVVVLEPDSLGIVPWIGDWCQPTVTDATSGNQVPAPGADPADRFAQLQYAIATIHAKAPAASVYLDGTHSAWLGVDNASKRLYWGGIQQADGFFLNISNYQYTPNLAQYGTWISQCLTSVLPQISTPIAPPPAPQMGTPFDGCANQYWNGGPDGTAIAAILGPWTGDALNNNGVWSDTATDPTLNTSGINARYAGITPTIHFIIDTSRNGNGPLNAAQYAGTPYFQNAGVISGLTGGNWCNPPGAGLGLRPTASTGVASLDAYLWVKVPGESDGSCDIAGGARAWDFTAYDPWGVTGAAQNNFDPLWGMVDPGAGAWFKQAALQLAQLASPPLL